MSAATVEILIAEDSSTQAERLRYLLDQHHYQVTVVDDGRRAFDWLQQHHPGVIITDINMPRLNGYDLCRQVKADPQLRDIPVILLTSMSDSMDVLEGLACGADGFITKPYSEAYLLARVEQTLLDAALPHGLRASIKVEIAIPGRSGVISADPYRMVSLLMSTYEAAIFRNTELMQAQEALRTLNEHLEDLVEERTAGLKAEIVERQKAERHIRYLAGVLENVSDAIVSFDLAGNIQSWNAGAEAMFGYSAQAVQGLPYAEIVPYEYTETTAADIARALEVTGRWHGEVRARQPAGSPIDMLVACAVLLDSAGTVTGFSAVLHDVTDRRQVETAVRASELRFRALIENSSDAITLLGSDGQVLYDSPAAPGLLGYAPDAWVGHSLFEFLHPDDQLPTKALLQQLLEQPAVRVHSQVRLRHNDGSWRWIEATVSNLLDDSNVQAIVVNYRDITERQQAQAALAQTNELLSQAEEIGRMGSWERDLASNSVVWSRGLYDILGLSPLETAPGVVAYLELVHPDDRQLVEQIFAQAVTATATLEYENRIVLPNGLVHNLSSRVKLLRDRQGQPERLAGVAIDITVRKQRERELEAMAAISTALRTAETQAQMLPIVLEQITELLGTSAAAVAMRDPETEVLEIALGLGEMASLTGLRLPPGSGIGGQALVTGQPYLADDLTKDPYWYQVGWLREPRAAACVPLITSQNVLGVAWAIRPTPFTVFEVRVLVALAGIAASAFQRAALHEQTEERLRRLSGLRDIDNAIMHSLDLNVTLNVIVAQVIGQLDVDACDILLFSRGFNGLEYAAGRGFRSQTVERTRLRLGEGYAGQAALERRLVAVPDIAAGPDPLGHNRLFAAEAFVTLFCVPLIAKGQVVGVLEVFHRTPLNPNADWLSFLEVLAGQTAIAIADAWLFADLQRSNADLRQAYDTTLEGWSAALDLRDKETEGHSQRVTEITVRLARVMGVREADLESLRRGALLHDIGKMAVPDAILHKPGPLTADEWVSMRQHPGLAHELLSPIEFLRPALDIPYCHHEKWDGTGYPRQLKGEEIPLSARIFSVVDVWDALRSNRPYRKGWPEAKVLAYIQEQSGRFFDPTIVEAFIILLAEIAAVEPIQSLAGGAAA